MDSKKTLSLIRFTNILFNVYIYLCRICLNPPFYPLPRALYACAQRDNQYTRIMRHVSEIFMSNRHSCYCRLSANIDIMFCLLENDIFWKYFFCSISFFIFSHAFIIVSSPGLTHGRPMNR